MADTPCSESQPDPDLLEYVLVSAASVDVLGPVASAVADVVHTGTIGLVDAVVLARPDARAKVLVGELTDHAELNPLTEVVEDVDRTLLSLHDIELAAVTLAPGVAALLLLVEDRWAGRVSTAARDAGGRVTAGERIDRGRVQAALGRGARSVRADLLARSPVSVAAIGPAPAVDPAEQVRKLARLVDRGLLSLDQYEVQRRRVLDG